MSFDSTTQRTIDLFSPHGGSILISDVVIGDKRRDVKSDYVKKLADSIKQVGLINPITIAPDNRLIAGYHRLQAFIQLGETRIPTVILNLSELEARLAEIDENLIRNEGSALERGEWLLERKSIYEELFPETVAGVAGGLARHGSASEIISFAEDTADKTGQSRRTIEQEIQIARDIAPEVKEKIRDTDLSDHKTDLLKLSRLEPEKQAEVVDRVLSGRSNNVKSAIIESNREERIEALGSPELPTGEYSVIMADPPWRYQFSETPSREIENQYPTMDLSEIRSLTVPAADDSILFMWTTAPKLEEAFSVLNSWGFTYKTCAIWDKERKGMGYYFRINHEILLVATKGKFPAPSPENRPDSIIRSPRGEHSKKPEEFYEIIEAMYPEASKLEMFCRSPREGWNAWGNEV